MASAALRSLEYWAYQYRRTWRGTIASSFLSPVLYMAAMGLGLGSLVDRSGHGASLAGGGYLAFLAPGLLAATAMQTAATEATWPVMGAIKWVRTYHAMLATPLRVVDVLAGHLAWMALRLLLVSAIFLGVMAAFGTTPSPWALAALPAAALTGMAFAAPITAFAATRENDAGFSALFRFGIIPMFLFSGTFFPIGQLPAPLRPVAWVTPLWHGVALCRALDLGTATAGPALGHVAYLGAWAAAGTVLARRAFHHRLAR